MNIIVLLAGLVAVGFSGPFNEIMVKHCGWSAFHVAAGRMLIASMLLWPLAASAARAAWRDHRGDLLRGGAWLGLHFGLWTGAFAFASLSSAVMFLAAQPLVSLWLTRRDNEERPSRGQLAGGILGALGLILIAWRDARLSPDQLLGDVMVVLAGIAIVKYQLATRRANRVLSPVAFNSVVWGLAGLFLLPGALLAGWPPGNEGWRWVAGLVLVPTFLGHGCFNWVIPRIKLIVVNLGILVEPVLAITIGWLMDLETWPAGWRLAGMVLVVSGVSLALVSEHLGKRQSRHANSVGESLQQL